MNEYPPFVRSGLSGVLRSQRPDFTVTPLAVVVTMRSDRLYCRAAPSAERGSSPAGGTSRILTTADGALLVPIGSVMELAPEMAAWGGRSKTGITFPEP